MLNIKLTIAKRNAENRVRNRLIHVYNREYPPKYSKFARVYLMNRPIHMLLVLVGVIIIAPALSDEKAPHWSFQALEKPAEPALPDKSWVRNPIDSFVKANLLDANLRANPEADKLTLIRRLTIDLTGLPPTIEEIDAYLADSSPDAYAKLVDRLLDSPHYGERWGRHWLDVARYVQGKTKVAAVDRVDMAEPYRDYVIRALNSDKPYDRFVTEQLAGDLLPPSKDPIASLDQLAASGFLSIGPWFSDCADPNTLRMDIIDEQISATSQAFLGMNFSCARCHDHFFDPIPTRDYYALAGIFGSTRIVDKMNKNWRDGRFRLTRPQATPEEISTAQRISDRIAKLRKSRWSVLKEAREKLLAKVQPRLADYDQALADLPNMPIVEIEAEDYHGQNNVRRVELDGEMLVETQRARLQWVQYRPSLPIAGTYTVYLRCAAPEALPIELKLDGETVFKDQIVPASGGWEMEHFRWVSLGSFQFRKGTTDARFWAQEHSSLPRFDKIRFVRTPPNRWHLINDHATEHGVERPILSELQIDRSAWPPNVADTERFVTLPALEDLDRKISALQKESPRLPRMLAVTDQAEMKDEPVHLKGEVYKVEAEAVPRSVPTIANSFLSSPKIPADTSGRLQLAKWIVDDNNPLTARVIANRLWQGHFGRGIVGTPGDLGIQGMRPTNQPLLDWLAATLIKEKWSLKALHRIIVNSSTYRMSSESNSTALSRDPDNKLHWGYPRRRLEAEAIYDGMLTASGKVPRQPSRQPLDNNRSKDRALYILTSSRSPLGMGIEIRKMLSLFGYDPSGVPVHQRDHSATTAQSLFWLNNKLPNYYAMKLAERLLAMPDLTEEERITMAFRIAIGRPPTLEIMRHTRSYLDHCRASQSLEEKESWSRICLGIFSSDTFSYLE